LVWGGELVLGSALSCSLLSGCAGPTTPLGSVWATRLSEVSQIQRPETPEEPAFPTDGPAGVKIDFRPARQILHGPKPFIIHIEDLAGIDSVPKIEIRYDGIDVTTSFMRQAVYLPDRSSTHVDLKIPVVRLSPMYEHRIEVSYVNSKGEVAVSEYRPPVCRIFDFRKVQHTDEFDPDPGLLTIIEKLSTQAQVNPALITGLIAQESSFNSRTVSWAKAIGLTQMTPIAEDEMLGYAPQYQSWPRYQGLASLPASLVKMFVLSGKINEKNDWRLDKNLSVQGGLAYLQLLEKRWSTPEVKARFDEVERTKLLLASYNSGSTRVQAAVRNYGKNWLNAPELREARRYVQRIFSYCDFFSQEMSKELEDQLSPNGIGNGSVL
jgi:hypothetical protein